MVTWEDESGGVGGATGDSSGSAVKAQVFAVNLSPTIASNGGGDNASISRFENSTAVTTVTATDPDPGTTLAFSIIGGADAARFQINATTGALSFIAAPNFEAPADSDANNSYVVQVRASDGALFDDQAITVNVTDVNETATISTVGTEILVNTATVSAQAAPQITALANGGFVVTWQDFSDGIGGAPGDGSQNALKAQVFAANGTPVGSELLVNTATNSVQDQPQITALANGGFVVTWRDLSNGVGGATGDSSQTAVKAQVFAADGDARRLGAPGQHRDGEQSGRSADHGAGERRLRGDVEGHSQGAGGATGDNSQRCREGAGVRRRRRARGLRNPGQHRDR